MFKLLIFMAFLAYASFTLGNACKEYFQNCLASQAQLLNKI